MGIKKEARLNKADLFEKRGRREEVLNNEAREAFHWLRV